MRLITTALFLFTMGAQAQNILFISVDDMRVEPRAITPNIDTLAGESVVYTQAYSAAAWCLPSRNSVMYGVSPAPEDTTPLVSLPEVLSANGYTTAVTGKIFHHHDLQPHRWDTNGPKVDITELFYASVLLDDSTRMPGGVMPAGVVDQDEIFAAWAVGFMQETTGPWFLAVGFFQPHLPWMADQQDYDQYQLVTPYTYTNDLVDEPQTAIDLANAPYFNETAQYDLVEAAGAAETKTRDYLAAVTHTDRMIGQVLSAAPEGTTVILWADHGFHLGEKRHWRKQTLWQQTVHVPLIIRDGGPPAEITTPVSLVDLAPTVLDLANLPPFTQFQGTSLRTGSSPVVIYHDQGTATVSGSAKTVDYGNGQQSMYDLSADPMELTNLTPPGC